MMIFCLLHSEPLSLLYLKALDSLVEVFVTNNMVEFLIRHLNNIKVVESLYKPVKQLKLKLIKYVDRKFVNDGSAKNDSKGAKKED